jgi:spermidine synthase/tetratricopeptide (TPR) repeat protein
LPPRRLAGLLLFVSGAASLTYEVVWFRLLALHVGAGAGTLAALLAGFLGGLGLGSWCIRRSAERARRPFLLAAALEGGAALTGVLSPVLFPLALRLFDRLGGPPAGSTLLASALVAAPAALMGASFPVLVRAGVADAGRAGETTARLYGWNTLGGACGALGAGFVLLPSLGITASLCAAALAQIGVAGGAVAIGLRIAGRQAPPPGAPATSVDRPPVDLLCAYALGGCAALAAEVAWTQVMQAAFGSSAYALAIVLCAYLTGLGLGSFLPAPRIDRAAQPALLLGFLQVGAATAVFLLIPLLGRLPLWSIPLGARASVSPLLNYAGEGALAGLVLLPSTALLGASFPVACRALGVGARVAPAVGAGAAANLLGALAGIAAGRWWVEGLGLRRTLILAALVHAGAAALILIPRLHLAPRRPIGAAMAALLLAALLGRAEWSPGILARGGYLHGPLFAASAALGGAAPPLEGAESLRFYRETSAGVVSVREGPDGSLSLAINGRIEASTGGDRAAQLLMGHLPALLQPQARSALVVGLASGMTLGALARHPLERIDCVELNAAVVEAARQFDASTGAPLRDPRVRVHVGDARRWLTLHPGPYDLIVSQPSNLWVAGISALFTEEFFERARLALSDQGLLAIWVQAYAIDPIDFRAILSTFQSVFPAAFLWEEALAGGDYFLIGSHSGEPPDWRQVEAALARPAVRSDLTALGLHGLGDLLARQVAGPGALRSLGGSAPRITDDSLRLEFTTPLALRRQSVPEIVELLAAASSGRREFDLTSLPAGSRRRALARLAELDRQREADRRVLELLAAEAEALGREPGLQRAAILLASGWRRAAAEEIERLLEERPGHGLAWLLLGAARLSEGGRDWIDPARLALQRASELRPHDPTAWNLLGRALALAGEEGQARAAFDRALSLRPAFSEALNNRAALALAAGRPAEALPDLRHALELDSASAPLRVNLGLALRRLGRTQESRDVYQEGLAIDPAQPDLHFNLATLDLELGRAAEALEGYRRAAALAGSDAQTERGQGLSLLALGRRREALIHLTNSLELDPSQADLARLVRSLRPGAPR